MTHVERQAPHISGKGSLMNRGTSSLFDIPSKLEPAGQSYISLAVAPSTEIDIEGPARPKIEYENTYQMEPPQRFIPERVKPVIFEQLSTHIGNMEYDPVQCSILAKTIAHEVKCRVKAMDFKRFKIICIINIGEKRSQDVRQGSRCLWDAQRDNFASTFYENAHIFATGTVYAVYFE